MNSESNKPQLTRKIVSTLLLMSTFSLLFLILATHDTAATSLSAGEADKSNVKKNAEKSADKKANDKKKTEKNDAKPKPDKHGIVVSKSMNLFDGKTLKGWKSTNFGGEGDIAVKDKQIIMEFGSPMTGITWKGDPKKLPKTNYEITLDAMRVDGSDFFCGLTFPVKKDPCSLILGGWGGGTTGLSSINGADASENETTDYRMFENKKWYKVRLRVLDDRIQAWVDGKEIVCVDIKDKQLGIRIEVEQSRPLGIASFQTTTAIRNFKLHWLDVSKRKKDDDDEC